MEEIEIRSREWTQVEQKGWENNVAYTKLVIEKENGYVVAAINHPPANAIGQAVLVDLNTLLGESLEYPGIRVIVLTGTGEKLFSAGADITEFDSVQAGSEPNGNRPYIEGDVVFSKIENYPKPVIAAMQGGAYGGGTELSLACHLRMLADTAKVGLPEVNWELCPAGAVPSACPD